MLAQKDSYGKKTYYHPDHLGSTTVISKQDGTLDERISYLPYGKPRLTSVELYLVWFFFIERDGVMVFLLFF
jgi:hypothetical protein